MTPCTTHALNPESDLHLFDWFYSHHASLVQIQHFIYSYNAKNWMPNICWVALRAAREVDLSIYRLMPRTDFGPFNADSTYAIGFLLREEFAYCADACSCLCSIGGCSPLVIFVKTLLESYIGYRPILNSVQGTVRIAACLKVVEQIILIASKAVDWHKSRSFYGSAISFTLFTMLELSHVCCYHSQMGDDHEPPKDAEDRREIQESRSESLGKFQFSFVPSSG